MIEVPIFNQAGKEVEKFQLDETKLGGEIRKNLLKQALVMYHANQRQGTAKTQGRGEVEGSTRKLFRQKGTGGARMGGIRQPVRRGGGHAKQRRPKDWRQALPKKARQLATRNAILLKFQSNEVRVLDSITLAQPKTKLMNEVYKALGLDRSVLFALEGPNEMVEKSARNIERTTLTTISQLNAWDILRNRTLLMTKAGLVQLLA